MLNTQVQELEANKVALTVEVEKEKVNAAYKSFFTRAARQIRIPGFRQGKAPRNVIAAAMGQEYVKAQIEEELIQDVYAQAIKDNKLQPVGRFELVESHLKENEPYTFKIQFEVRPKLGEFNYKGMSTQVQREIVDEESVDKVIEQVREQQSKTEAIEDGELTVGDYFSAKLEVSCDGETDEELSDDKMTHKLLKDDKLFSFCEGMKIGESRTTSRKNEDESQKDSKYYGKTLEYKVTLTRISRPTLPELNDEFAQRLGDYKDVEALKVRIREDLEERSKFDAEERAFDDILSKIIEEYKKLY